ncbi:polymer-forming cytoskeletal protein [Campylobacter sp. LR264d]|uniref:bactofilin family protein n=1 Tax=Campylobacter sp. LR264d TaxID=2593544 RepID=UPI0012393B28|nr:polymer-forming cytoskeletal protein [Campylobacter sp. LR264d]KAA6233578.1 polymer-forming cytoskeletal protein [Campylobacter sp. LR264d]
MAIFGKGSDIATSNANTETTVIATGSKLEGKFYFTSMLHIDGEMSGIIHSENIVVVGKNGNLKGELKADKVVINGYFEGELEADSLEILSSGAVIGNITIKELSIENGGKFSGGSTIKEDSLKLLETNSD